MANENFGVQNDSTAATLNIPSLDQVNQNINALVLQLASLNAAIQDGSGLIWEPYNSLLASIAALSSTLVTGDLIAGSGAGTVARAPLGQIPGTSTNDDAAAGKVGEYLSTTVLVASQVSLTTATTSNVATLALSAGDWDVGGNVVFNPNGSTTITTITAAISQVSATLPTKPGAGAFAQIAGVLTTGFATGGINVLPVGGTRVSLASPTSVYLVAQSIFAASTMAAYGFIGARRAR